MLLVQASLAISFANLPVPVTGVPAEAVKPFALIAVTLNVVACGVSISFANVCAVTSSLQTVSD